MNPPELDIDNSQNPFTALPAKKVGGDRLGLNSGLWRRFCTVLIDEICIVLIGLLLVQLLLLILSVQLIGYGFADLLEELPTAEGWLIVRILYYVIFESLFGRTIGKFRDRTKVIDEQGRRPSWRRTIIRTLCRLIPFDYISIYFSANKQCWHDILSNTRVIDTDV